MQWDWKKPRVGLRELLWLLGLILLLIYAFLPIRRAGNTSDPVASQLRNLQDGSTSERRTAVVELARQADREADRVVPALVGAVRDRDPEVRLAAVGSLHVVKPDDPHLAEAAAALIGALADAEPRVRAMAAGTLPALNVDPKQALPALIQAATPEPASDHPGSEPATPAATPEAAQEFIARTQRDHARAGAIVALGRIGPHDPAVQKKLVDLAGDPVSEVRSDVARLLGEIGPEAPGALAALSKLAADPDLYVQARAITALGNFPEDHAASCPLIYKAYLSGQRQLQEGAELSLEKIVKSKEFPALAAAQSKDPAQRFAAVFGLSPNSDAGFQALLRALKDEDPGVRIMAAANLAKASSRRSEEAVNAVKSLAADQDAEVVAQMHRTIKLLSPRPPRS